MQIDLNPQRWRHLAMPGILLAIAALALALVGPCTCHCTSLIAIPIGAYGVWTAIGAREGGSSESREMATVSLVGGTMATLWSLLWVAFISLYIGIYIFVIAFMVAAGGMNQ